VLVPITSIDDPRVEDYRAVKARQVRPSAGSLPPDHSGEFLNGTFLAEGELVVRLLLNSRFRTRSVFLTSTRLETLKGDLERLPPETPVYVADQSVMSGVVGFDIHRGVLASADRGDLNTLSALLASRPAGLVLLEDLANADNVGAIFRNCAALAPGFGIVLSPACCDPLYRKAIRVSMGHILHVPFALTSDWERALSMVKDSGYALIALTPGEKSVPIHDLAPHRIPARPALLLGTEGAGVSDLAKHLADVRVVIPMSLGVDSLNVGVAAAIALHRLGGV
jgi:tRNA G18 (ribose-2'-O)-methylase SpoU